MLQDSFIEVHFVKENNNKGLFTVIWLICLIVIILLINMLPFLFGFPYLLLLTVSLSFLSPQLFLLNSNSLWWMFSSSMQELR